MPGGDGPSGHGGRGPQLAGPVLLLPDSSVQCRLRVRIHGEWIAKADVGAPSDQPDGGDRLKAAFSDALKRAAVKFGIGRYLYGLPPSWTDYDPTKRQFTSRPHLPEWAMPRPAPVSQRQRQEAPRGRVGTSSPAPGGGRRARREGSV